MLKVKTLFVCVAIALTMSAWACRQTAGTGNRADSFCAKFNQGNYYGDEAVERENIKQDIREPYLNKGLEGLDKLERYFTNGFPVTHSGAQKMVFFYSVLKDSFGYYALLMNGIADEWVILQPSSPAANILKVMTFDAKTSAFAKCIVIFSKVHGLVR